MLKHFTIGWVYAQANKRSGGKRLSGRTKPCANRARSFTVGGQLSVSVEDACAFLRRMKFRLGLPKR